MQTVRLPLLRGAMFIIALAAISIILARGDNPAQATTFEPQNIVSVSDPNPGAPADISISFGVNMPDSFPNLRTNPSIQFLPRQWGVHVPETDEEKAALIGAIAGTFDTQTTLGLGGPCMFAIPVSFRLMEANPDTGYDPATGTYDPQKLTSSLETGPLAGHPGGVGYAGQFVDDPDTVQAPGDLGLPLRAFNADEKHTTSGGFPLPYEANQWAYRDIDGDGYVSVDDVRLTQYKAYHPVGTVVQPGNMDLNWDTDGDGLKDRGNPLYNFSALYKHSNPDLNGQMDPGEGIYKDVDGDGAVSYGDIRMFVFGQELSAVPTETVVEDFRLPGGVYRYPDFLNKMFRPDVVGEPLARQFGAQNVMDVTAASLNIVTFRPGQLPGYPASLGYPNVVVVLNPADPMDIVSINTTSDLCAPLALASTNFGISKDNPTTLKDEAGYVRLTNPKAEKSHEFTLITTSQPDADDDGIENMLDSCPLTPNTVQDERLTGMGPDGDSLDSSCDPDPAHKSPTGGGGWTPKDEDVDSYGNMADNCSTVANGVEFLGRGYVRASYFTLYYGITGDLIGPNNQLDTDGDDIGDACEGAESGGPGANLADQQCVNAGDDDGDGAINDGCPTNPIDASPESSAQCTNATDDDGDGYVNDGCPKTAGSPETGDQCLNNTDDDGDGLVNDGCPKTTGSPETGDQCLNNTDDDGDGLVNDGCPTVGGSWRREYSCNDALDNEAGWQGGPDGYVNDGCPVNGAGIESGAQCANATDDDTDGVVNDGCPVNGPGVESGTQCDNNTDDDTDGVVNDGCPAKTRFGAPETGDQCNNATDDDADGLVNDGCPAVDPGDVAKTTITGHMHVVTLKRSVAIARHGIKLDDLDGPESVALNGSGSYRVGLENKSGSAEEIQVALRVVEGCGAVDGPSAVHVNGDASANADFTVDFSGCAAGEYTVQADACHAGDPAPTGFFGLGACPGTSDIPRVSSQLSPSGAVANSEYFGPGYGAAMAIDNNTTTGWGTYLDGTTGFIQASFSSPADIDRVDMENDYFDLGVAGFVSGTLTFSNGYSQDVTLTNGAGSFSIPWQSGVEWVRFTGNAPAGSVVAITEFKIFGFQPVPADTNPLDDAPRSLTVVVGTP